jgi:uncharacterized protein (DUF983 family)
MNKSGILKGTFHNLCPNCNRGKVFKGFLSLNRNCPVCGYLLIKEEGYFIGTMIAAYFISFFASVPVFLAGYFVFEVDLPPLIAICSVEMIILGPLFYRWATLLWLWIETTLQSRLDEADQKKKK